MDGVSPFPMPGGGDKTRIDEGLAATGSTLRAESGSRLVTGILLATQMG